MANITRTITSGYNYDVMQRNGDTLVKIGVLETDKQPRSIKQQKEVLAKNEFDTDCLIIFTGVNEKKYFISEEIFMKYAVEVKESPAEQPESEENK